MKRINAYSSQLNRLAANQTAGETSGTRSADRVGCSNDEQQVLKELLSSAQVLKRQMPRLIAQYGSDGAIIASQVHGCISEIHQQLQEMTHGRTDQLQQTLKNLEEEIGLIRLLPPNIDN